MKEDLLYNEEPLSPLLCTETKLQLSRINFRALEDIDEESKRKGEILYRYFFMPICASGRAFYQIVDIANNKAVIKRCKGICIQEHYDRYFGEEAIVNLDWVKMQILALDKIRDLFPGIHHPTSHKVEV